MEVSSKENHLEITDSPIHSMVDLPIVMLNYRRVIYRFTNISLGYTITNWKFLTMRNKGKFLTEISIIAIENNSKLLVYQRLGHMNNMDHMDTSSYQ